MYLLCTLVNNDYLFVISLQKNEPLIIKSGFKNAFGN